MNINMILCLVNKRNITFFYQKCWDIENSIAIILYYIQYIYTYNNILLFIVIGYILKILAQHIFENTNLILLN